MIPFNTNIVKVGAGMSALPCNIAGTVIFDKPNNI
jgi:hypothetical protein